MNLEQFKLTSVKTNEELAIERIQNLIHSKNHLIERIIGCLTENPEEMEYSLISGFFSIADTAPSETAVSNFQNMWFAIRDAKKLKLLIQEESEVK